MLRYNGGDVMWCDDLCHLVTRLCSRSDQWDLPALQVRISAVSLTRVERARERCREDRRRDSQEEIFLTKHFLLQRGGGWRSRVFRWVVVVLNCITIFCYNPPPPPPTVSGTRQIQIFIVISAKILTHSHARCNKVGPLIILTNFHE